MYTAIVTKLENVKEHPNADKLKLATCRGSQIIIGLDQTEGALGVYFPTDGQLSDEFCKANNLYRDSSKNTDSNETGMFEDNRRVRTQKIRGEISDGFWVPLDFFGFIHVSGLDKEGFEFSEWGKVPICNRYISPATFKASQEQVKVNKKSSFNSIMFKTHYDTKQFKRNLENFKNGQFITISEKVHGTSHRIGRVLLKRKLSWIEKALSILGAKIQKKEWVYMNGSRRVNQKNPSGIRESAFLQFNGKLKKGETVYLEIVGFNPDGTPIMPPVDTRKMKNPEFTKRYGEIMNFSYRCEPTQSKVFVYRMTTTNEDGESYDYSWEDIMIRCEEMNVKHTPLFIRTTLNEISQSSELKEKLDDFNKFVEVLATGPSTIDGSHIREGVVVKIEQGFKNQAYKEKSYDFKVLEGIIKDSGVIDIEEVEDQII